MADNLDDFLKRAAERREQRAKQKQQPAPQVAPPMPSRPQQVQPSRPAQPQQPQRTNPSRPVPPPYMQPTATQQSNRPVPNNAQNQRSKPPQKPAKPKDPKRLAPTLSNEQKLARDVALADDRMGSHLQDVFSHQVGQLDAGQSAKGASATHSPKDDSATQSPDATQMSLAKQVAAALRDPQSAKIAFVASEIFRRRF